MKKITATDPESRSADLLADNVGKLRELFPQAFTEGKVDFQVLRELLGDAVEEREERYGLNWHGKAKARRLAMTPSTGTLRPVKGESVDWDTTQNLIIEGDNLEVLKLLQKSYAGKVKLIYIDPPYNTGNDFVYPDDYRDTIESYLRRTNQTDEEGFGRSTNSESSGRFHTDWLNMMLPRLHLARQLLGEDGALFVTIDDHENHNLRSLLDEIFGPENFCAELIWRRRVSPANDATWFSVDHDYVAVYAKNKSVWRPNRLARTSDQLKYYTNPDDDPRGDWNSATYTCNKSKAQRPNLYYTIRNPNTEEEVFPETTAVWRFSEDKTRELLADNRLYWGQDGTSTKPRLKKFLSEAGGVVPRSVWDYSEAGSTQEASTELRSILPSARFDTPKPVRLMRQILAVGTNPKSGDVVLDFFAGSGTTGHAVLEANHDDGGNRRFVLIQLPEPADGEVFETICDITRSRVRAAAANVGEEAKPGQEADLGFRSFHLDSTSLRPWDPTPADLQTQLGEHVDHIKPDRTEDDLLYEVLLKLGIDLSVPIETRTMAGFEVHNIGAGQLLACFGTPIRRADTMPLARGITKWHDESRPAAADAAASTATLLFRDAGFEDDVAKQNLVHALEQAGLTNVRSL